MIELGHESTTQAAFAPVHTQEPLSGWRPRTWLVVIPLALIVIYAFTPVLYNGFNRGDDDVNFLHNPYFRGLGLAQVNWAWTTSRLGVYQPLAWLLYSAQFVLWQLTPGGYHLISLLFQVANAAVLYVLTMALLLRCRNDSCLQSPWRCSLISAFATALFAVHPLRVETVAWVSAQMYLPCALFSMLAVLAYLRAFPTDSPPRHASGWLAGSFFLFVAALLFHPTPVTLPLVLLILDVYPLRRILDETGQWFGASARRVIAEKIPFVITSLFFMVIAITVRTEAHFQIEPFDASVGLAQACYSIWFYIFKTVFPLDITALYLLPVELNWLAFPYSLAILAASAMSAGLFVLRRSWPGPLAAWLSYLAILAPNSGIIRNNHVIAADRYSYMSMLSFVVLAAAGCCRLWQMSARWRPAAATAIIAVGLAALLGLTAMTRNQCRTWLNDETFWVHILTHSKHSQYVAHYNLGLVLATEARHDAAVAHFLEALRLKPSHDQAHNGLGNVLYTQGKYDRAEDHFTEALRLNPANADAHKNLGVLLQNKGNHQAAAAHLTEALRLNPGHADAHNNLGVVFDKQGKYQEALAHFTEALRLNPDFADAHNNLAMVLASHEKYAEAEARYVEVARLKPRDDTAHNNLGKVLSKEGKNDEAVVHFNEALRLNPGSVDAHYNLGLVFSHLGNYEAAKARYTEAMLLQPGDPRSYNASAMLMAACPDAKFRDGKKAVGLATRACELTQWKNPIVLDTLAAAQAEAGDFDAAVKSQKRAIELLTDQRRKDDYRTRLAIYEAKRPYRQVAEQPRPD